MTAQLPALPSKERTKQIANFHRTMSLPPSHAEIEALARYAMAGMEQEPVAWMVDGWVSNDKKWAERRSVEDNLLLETLYCHPIITGIDENHYNPELEPGIYVAEIMTKGGAAIINGYYAEQPVPVVSERPHEFLPKNLDQALMVMGMALPESREEFNFQSERWIQRLINAVIRMGKQEQPAMISDSDKILSDICDLFKIGELARTRSAIMTNIENTINFAEKLHAIEHEFFMAPGEPDDDYPDEEPMDECLVNSWGSTTEQYVEQFRAALKNISVPVAVPDDELINRKAFERFANNLGYSDASYFTTDTHPNYYDDDRINEMWCSWNAFRAAMLNHFEQSLAMVNPPAIPAGWKLVPIEPTADMSHAGHDYYQKSKAEFGDFTPTGMYRAMLAAAPQPPVSTSGWIKCSDRKPAQRNYISAVSHHGEYVSGIVNGEWIDLFDGSTFAIADIYLWFLLPEIPAAPKPERD